jgi:hypothetical protein
MWLSIAVALATITVDPPPIADVESAIVVTRDDGEPAAGVTVRVFHRPDLVDVDESGIGVTDARGRVLWTPDEPGRARLQAGEERHDLVVAWPSLPVGRAVLLALLVLLGFGAAAQSVRARA